MQILDYSQLAKDNPSILSIQEKELEGLSFPIEVTETKEKDYKGNPLLLLPNGNTISSLYFELEKGEEDITIYPQLIIADYEEVQIPSTIS